jgi:hypothetical protein
VDGVSAADYNSINETRANVYKISQAMRIQIEKVEPGRCCSPRHPTHFEASNLEFNDNL